MRAKFMNDHLLYDYWHMPKKWNCGHIWQWNIYSLKSYDLKVDKIINNKNRKRKTNFTLYRYAKYMLNVFSRSSRHIDFLRFLYIHEPYSQNLWLLHWINLKRLSNRKIWNCSMIITKQSLVMSYNAHRFPSPILLFLI